MSTIRIDILLNHKILHDSNGHSNQHLRTGEIVCAKILEVLGDHIKLDLAGQLVSAKISANIELKANQFVNLKSNGLVDGRLQLSFLPEINSPDQKDNTAVKSTLNNLNNLNTLNTANPLVRLGLADTQENRFILDMLIKNNLEITKENYTQIKEIAQNLQVDIKSQQLGIVTAALSIKHNVANSPEAINAIYSYLSKGEQILNLIESLKIQAPVESDSNKTGNSSNVEQSLVVKISQNLENIKSNFYLKSDLTNLIKIVQTILKTPESILYQAAKANEKMHNPLPQLHNNEQRDPTSSVVVNPTNSKEVNDLNPNLQTNPLLLIKAKENLISSISYLIKELEALSGKEVFKGLIKQLQTVKQVFQGNLILAEQEPNNISFLIPFIYNQQHCYLRLSRRRGARKENNNPIYLKLHIEHTQLGQVSFNLKLLNKQLIGEIWVESNQSKMLFEKKMPILVESLKSLGYELFIGKIMVNKSDNTLQTNEKEEYQPPKIISLLDLNQLDITI